MSEKIEEQINELMEAATISDTDEVEKKVHQYATAAAGAMKLVSFFKGDKTSFRNHYDIAASHMYDHLSTHPDVHPKVRAFAKQKAAEHFANIKSGEILNSMKKKNMNENNLIESTINFVENAARKNGNLRSGVIDEATFPKNHVEQGLKVHQNALDNDATGFDADGAVMNHAMKNLGYSRGKAEGFADHVNNLHTARKYTSGPRSSGDKENIHGALGGSGKYAK